MALVGSIRVGTINGLVQSLRRTNVKATLTVRSGEDEGNITFRDGQLEQCEVDVLDGADALDEMLTWSHGQFTLRLVDAEIDDTLDAEGPHVMVVDDELGVRKLIEAFLEAEGYRVSVVSQASQAVNLVDYCRPDLVLLDVMLTGIDGFELGGLLRQQYSRKQLPIVLMSANHDFAKRAADEGFPFFGKPFDFKKLCESIDSLTGSAADLAVSQRFSGSDEPREAGAREAGPAVEYLRLPARFATLLDAEAHLPDPDLCYMVDEVAKARFALVGPSPALAAIVAGFDGFLTLRQWLDEDPDTREQRVLMALLLHAVGALHTADAAFGIK
jgi:CheY-like chemotaxis protein